MNITTELLQASIDRFIKEQMSAKLYSGVKYVPEESGTGKYVTLPINDVRTPIGADCMKFRGQIKEGAPKETKAYIIFTCGAVIVWGETINFARNVEELDKAVGIIFENASHRAYDKETGEKFNNVLTLKDIEDSFKTHVPSSIGWELEFKPIDANNSEYSTYLSYIQTVPKSKSIRIHGWCLQTKVSSVELVFSDDTSKTFPISNATELKEFLKKYVGWTQKHGGTGKLTSMDLQQQVDEINEKIDRIMEELKLLSKK